MFKALYLGNFKAFAETQRVPIRPLTIIFGPNSAGKSSLIHGLLLAHEACHSEDGTLDIHRPELGGDSVDLGGFRQFVHKRDLSRRVEWGVELDVSSLTGRLKELLAPVSTARVSVTFGLEQRERKVKRVISGRDGKPVEVDVPTGEMAAVGQPRAEGYTVIADDKTLLSASLKRDGQMTLDELASRHPVLAAIFNAVVETMTTATSLGPGDLEGLDDVVKDLVPGMRLPCGGLLPGGLSYVPAPDQGETADGTSKVPQSPPMLFPISKGNRKEDLAQAARFVLPRILDELVGGLTGHIMADLDGLRYLGPLRSYPPRHLAFSQQEGTNWFAGGGHAWDVVRRDERIRKVVNEWLSSTERLQTPYKIECNRLLALEQAVESAESELGRHVDGPVVDRSYLAERYEQGEPTGEQEEVVPLALVGADVLSDIVTRSLIDVAAADAIDDLVMIDQRTGTRVTHRDVGVGISQVLPVLVSAYAAEGSLVAIEQPEIHLHPKLQAELGDVFIQSALERGNTFILETHSEHLILRLLRRIRETTEGCKTSGLAIRPEDVAILYTEPTPEGARILELRVDSDGEFIDRCPHGFFEERAEELF